MYRNNCEQNNLTSHLPMFLSFHSDSQHIHLEDKIANLWIKYFMMAAPDQESIQQAPPDIRIFFNDFNIDGIMPSVIHKNLSKIQSNPVEILPSILNFDQTISAAYFHFLRYISSLISLQEEKYIQASNLSIPHIMRAFIILTYSLPEIITNEANKKQSNLKVNYFTVLECLPYFADYFLNLEKEYYFDSIILLDNFFHVFASHFPVFFKQIDPQSCFFPVAKMVHKLIEKINSNCLINSSSISPFAEFISDFCHYSLSFIFNEKDYSPLLMAYLFFLVKNSHLLPNMENSAYWATNSFLVYFLTMITYVDDQKTLEEYVIYSLQILSILYPLRDINECANPFHSNSDSEKLAKVIFDIIKVLLKSFKNNGNENMNSKTICNNSGSETYCNEIKDSFDIVEYDYSKCSDEIINYSKFDFSSNNNCILSNETLKSLKTIISTLFGKSTKLFSHFIKLFIEAEQKDHFLQRCTYLCYLLSSLDVEIIASNLEKNQVWSTLICFKTIKSKSFRINSPNLPFIEYQNILCKIIKMVLCFSINSYKSSLITEICETLHTKNIKVIHGIINYLRSLIIDEESFENVSYSLSIHTLFIDLIMNIDRNIKVEIKKSLLLPVITEQKIQELIKCHYEIFLFMKEFLPYKLNNVVIFSNKSKRIYFVYSYLFEKDHHIHSIMNTIIAQAYQKVKSTYLLIKSIDEIIKFKLHTKSEQYLFSILSSFVNLIIMAIHSNPNDVSKYIMLCDSLQILAKLPNHLLLYHAKVQSFEELKDDFILCDEAYNDIIVMIHFLIQLNKELAMLSKDAANSINTNPSINVIFNLDNIAKYVKLNIGCPEA
ncbi:hypothetical protein TRFO_41241 [Tritrichomonas foetus]|uniref:Uncharacterized protein n=1 Tax=Tritrichomonas foetus TaxID=1144522 RepID=A0A1J4L5F9_9EUKA|nr:hypothetical protein TRFO_41241 [Tritrichomonas foetus]|eukprot:OHT17174.1 hypothetical protein TRFO_41241 [Tritrichomonas foetus]